MPLGAGVAARKALAWLAGRSKRVSQHVALHGSEQGVAAQTRPWILRKAAHSVTIGGDRVTRKICERTLKTYDKYVLQEGGRHAFFKDFGRQVGRRPGQTWFLVIVSATGQKIVTAFAVTEVQALTSTVALFILTEKVVECLEGMQRIEVTYKSKAPREESFIVELIDFLFMSDLGDEAAGEDENMYLEQDRYRTIMEQQYLSALQEVQGRSFGTDDTSDALKQFREGVAGAVAPYVEDEG
jgi:hypothetical protein